MKPDAPAPTPKPTPAEKKFDQAREEAFGNEGAPPPARASLAAANADQWGDDDGRAAASALEPVSTDDPGSASGPADETGQREPAPNVPARDAGGVRPGNGSEPTAVCSLLSSRVPSRGR